MEWGRTRLNYFIPAAVLFHQCSLALSFPRQIKIFIGRGNGFWMEFPVAAVLLPQPAPWTFQRGLFLDSLFPMRTCWGSWRKQPVKE